MPVARETTSGSASNCDVYERFVANVKRPDRESEANPNKPTNGKTLAVFGRAAGWF
jgi:hypothetical protein